MAKYFKETPPGRWRRATLSLGGALGLALTLPGCSFPGPLNYPVDWPRVDTAPADHGCPDLAGTYSDRVDGSFPADAEPLPLSEVFTRLGRHATVSYRVSSRRYIATEVIPEIFRIRDAWSRVEPSVTAEIDQTPDGLHVRFASTVAIEGVLDLQRDRLYNTDAAALYECTAEGGKPRLAFPQSFEGHVGSADPFLPGTIAFTQLFLYRGADGSLIAELRHYSKDKLVWGPDGRVQEWTGTISSFNGGSVYLRYPRLKAGR